MRYERLAWTCVLVVCLSGLSSCGLVRNTEMVLDQVKGVVEENREEFAAILSQGQEIVSATKVVMESVTEKKDQLQELWNTIFGVGGTGVLAGGAALARNSKSNERKAKAEAKLEALEDKVAGLQVGKA